MPGFYNSFNPVNAGMLPAQQPILTTIPVAASPARPMVLEGSVTKDVFNWGIFKTIGKAIIGAGIDALKGYLGSKQGNDDYYLRNSGISTYNTNSNMIGDIQGVPLGALTPPKSKVDVNFKPFIPKKVNVNPLAYNFNTNDNQPDMRGIIAKAQNQAQFNQQQQKPPNEKVINTASQNYNQFLNTHYQNNFTGKTSTNAGNMNFKVSVDAANAYNRVNENIAQSFTGSGTAGSKSQETQNIKTNSTQNNLPPFIFEKSIFQNKSIIDVSKIQKIVEEVFKKHEAEVKKIISECEAQPQSLNRYAKDNTNQFKQTLQQDSRNKAYLQSSNPEYKVTMDYIYNYCPLITPTYLYQESIIDGKIVKPEYFKYATFGYRLAEAETAKNPKGYDKLQAQALYDTVQKSVNNSDFKKIMGRNPDEYQKAAIVSGWTTKTKGDPWFVKRNMSAIDMYENKNYRFPRQTERILTQYFPEYNKINDPIAKNKIVAEATQYFYSDILKINLEGEAKGLDEYKNPIGKVTLYSPFDVRLHPLYKDYRMHKGVDISAYKGTPIPSQQSGKVVFAGWIDGYGRKVIIEGYDLNGKKYQTLYGHMDSISKHIKEGTMVNPGDILGKVGNSGASAGAHLHFGFGPDCKNHIYKDPGYRTQYVWENMTASYLKNQLETNKNFKCKVNKKIDAIIKKYAK